MEAIACFGEGEGRSIAVCGKGRRGERDRCLWEGEERRARSLFGEGEKRDRCLGRGGERDRCLGRGGKRDRCLCEMERARSLFWEG